MTSKSRAGYAAAYSYLNKILLSKIESDFPGETHVSFNYSGNGKRRESTVNSSATVYKWGSGIDLISEESSGGTLLRTYLDRTYGHVDGTDPATGSRVYYSHDGLGSVRFGRGDSKARTHSVEYTPYGRVYQAGGLSTSAQGFAKLGPENAAGLDYTMFRYYSPDTGRWIVRDPFGMADGENMFAYVRNNPVNSSDVLGLGCTTLDSNPEAVKLSIEILGPPKPPPFKIPPLWPLLLSLLPGDSPLPETEASKKGGKENRGSGERRISPSGDWVRHWAPGELDPRGGTEYNGEFIDFGTRIPWDKCDNPEAWLEFVYKLSLGQDADVRKHPSWSNDLKWLKKYCKDKRPPASKDGGGGGVLPPASCPDDDRK